MLILSCGCTRPLFYPDKEIKITPKDIGIKYEEISIETPENEIINAWFLPSETKEKSKYVIFFHGNAGNLSSHLQSFYWLPKEGFNVLAFDYRGFGKSTGSPSVNGSIKDSLAVIKYLENKISKNDKISVIGQSIGGAISITAVSKWQKVNNKSKIKNHIIISSFPSYRKIAREKLSELWLTKIFAYPLSFIISDSLSPQHFINEHNVPVLILHSKNDRIVPIEHGRNLFKKFKNKKEFIENNLPDHNSPINTEETKGKIINFLNQE